MDDDRVRRRGLLQLIGGSLLATTPATATSANGSVFQVSVSHTPSVVEEGDTSTVTGTITNTGDESDVQIVELDVKRDGDVIESRSTTFALDAGESASETRTANYEEYPGPGEYVGEVCSNDDCGTASWTVTESDEATEPFFEVELVGVTTTTAGGPIEAAVLVSNTGDTDGTQQLRFAVDGVGTDTRSVSVAAGAERRVSFAVPTTTNDAGEYTATVDSDDDNDSVTVTVLPRPEAVFEVQIVEITAPTAGDPVEAVIEVENTGAGSGDGEISLDIGGLGETTATVSLDSGETTTVSLEIPTAQGDSGEYTGTVSSDDDTESTPVTVEPQPAFFDVEVVDTVPDTAGEPVEVSIEVSNTGGQQGTQEIELVIDGLGSRTNTLALDRGNETVVSLSVPTEPGDDGEYTATVSSDDDTDTSQVRVRPRPAFFALEVLEVTTPTAGDPVDILVEVVNTGDRRARKEVALEIESLGSEVVSLSLKAESTETVSFTVPTERGDSGVVTATVSSNDDSVSREVTVTEPVETPAPNDDDGARKESPTGDDDDAGDGTEPTTATGTNVEDGDQSIDNEGAGFGIVSAVAGVGTAAVYLLKQQLDAEE